MSALTVTLGADITALKRAMAGATELVGASARRMSKMTGAGLAGLGKGGAAALSKGFSVAGTALKAGVGAALAGGAAAMGVGVKAVNAAADFEQTKVAFATLIGDAGKAEQTLAKLRELGAQTPFEFPELADAGRKLIAFGESADSVPETLRRIGDVSAGVQAPVNEIAELYGKARVQGRLFAEDKRLSISPPSTRLTCAGGYSPPSNVALPPSAGGRNASWPWHLELPPPPAPLVHRGGRGFFVPWHLTRARGAARRLSQICRQMSASLLRGMLYNGRKKEQGGTGANQHKQKDQNDTSASKEKPKDQNDTLESTAEKQLGQNDPIESTAESTAEAVAKETGVSPAPIALLQVCCVCGCATQHPQAGETQAGHGILNCHHHSPAG